MGYPHGSLMSCYWEMMVNRGHAGFGALYLTNAPDLLGSGELMFHSFTLPLVAGSFLFVTKSGRGFILGCVIWLQP
jgi:hypothetical protein